MYHIYTSPSLILSREPSGDSAYFRLLTRDLGLVVARAQGIRRDTSRLKGVLQEYSLATVAYVRTKAGWKITTAIAEENFFFENSAIGNVAENSSDRRKVMARITQSLIRFITGEENNPEIFDTVVAGFSALHQTSEAHGVELLILARILARLGYIAADADSPVAALFINNSDFGVEHIAQALTEKKVLVQAINKAFKESHL